MAVDQVIGQLPDLALFFVIPIVTHKGEVDKDSAPYFGLKRFGLR
jgi:hypothetical protein